MCMKSEVARRSRQIDAELRKQVGKDKHQLKILLLGTGESGKSTVVKQMKILYGGGFSEKEVEVFRVLVFRNCLRSIKSLVDGMELLEIDFGDPSLEGSAFDLVDTALASFNEIAPYKDTMKKIWNDSGIQQAYAQRTKFQLSVSTAYFLNKLDTLAKPDYLPDENDILRAREATTGIHEITFEVENAVFRMIDVGGQRSERRKWIHCFEFITTVIFIAAANEYDEVLAEDENTNRMKESVALFSQIIDYWWFRESSFVLFLNKQDLLEEKVKVSSLKDHFPEYNGPEKDAEAARKFIHSMYMKEKPESHTLYVHFTTATNTENIKYVFGAVKATIVRNHLKDLSIL
eukprot:m.42462 g.42462  ORF g.42462 m.42462 type:complete len:347 (-) comp10520_c0_seq1:145-1185(-)